MKKLSISICIPTLNREKLLLQSIASILEQAPHNLDLEVCISNNNSDENYNKIKKIIQNKKTFKYFEHEYRLTTDENHQFVINMATKEYVFFLGDDDYFEADSFSKIEKLINFFRYDLIVFNPKKIDADGNLKLGFHKVKKTEFIDANIAFDQLKNKCTFGAVLVKRKFLKNENIKKLYGTSHAYCGFWIELLNAEENIKIIVPDFPCVNLRTVEKNYNRLDVFYNDIFSYISILHQSVRLQSSKKIIEKYKSDYENYISSLAFLTYLFSHGVYKDAVININGSVFFKFKKNIGWILAKSSFFKLIKKIYFLIKR